MEMFGAMPLFSTEFDQDPPIKAHPPSDVSAKFARLTTVNRSLSQPIPRAPGYDGCSSLLHKDCFAEDRKNILLLLPE